LSAEFVEGLALVAWSREGSQRDGSMCGEEAEEEVEDGRSSRWAKGARRKRCSPAAGAPLLMKSATSRV
jgi:hypothetical protein